jgi:hypothetical protein
MTTVKGQLLHMLQTVAQALGDGLREFTLCSFQFFNLGHI